MLAHERRERIKEMIQAQHHLKISELSHLFNVSEMTIHRDIKPLIEQGWVKKTFGGISLVQEEAKYLVSHDDCVYCHRKVDQRLSTRLILSNHRIETACCAHCGILRHKQLGDEVMQMIGYDFFSHATISASMAWFVMDTTVDMHCCQPQLLPFGRKDYAEGFVKGFGGVVLSLEETIERLCGSDTTSERKSCCQHD